MGIDGLYSTSLYVPERRKERVSEWVLFFIEKKADKKRVPALSRCLRLQYDVQRRFANGKNTRTLLRRPTTAYKHESCAKENGPEMVRFVVRASRGVVTLSVVERSPEYNKDKTDGFCCFSVVVQLRT